MKITLKAMYITDLTPGDAPPIAAMIPAYPGAITQGDTIDEARQNLFDAIADLVDSYNDDVADKAAAFRAEGAAVVCEDVVMTLESSV